MADILTLPDARLAIRAIAADTSNDTDLTNTYIPATTTIVEDVVGPVMTATGLTWTVDGGKTQILLPSAVTAVTAVTETGTVLVANVDYTVNLRAGVVTRGSTQTPYVFLPGQQNIVVTYNAGLYAAPANVPANIKLGARIILRQMWQADQQGQRTSFNGTDLDTVETPSGFLIPRRAYELLLKGSASMPGFA